MANVSLEAFRTVRVIDTAGATTNIIADQYSTRIEYII